MSRVGWAWPSYPPVPPRIPNPTYLPAVLRKRLDGRPIDGDKLVDLRLERDSQPQHSLTIPIPLLAGPREGRRGAGVEQRQELDPLQEARRRGEGALLGRGVEELPRGEVDVVKRPDIALACHVALDEAEPHLVQVALVEAGDGPFVRQGELQPAGLGGDVDGLGVGEL